MYEKTHNDSLVILRAATRHNLFCARFAEAVGLVLRVWIRCHSPVFPATAWHPPALAAISILVEFFGGILLLLGLLTRAAAFLIAIIMAVALISVYLSQGFFIAGRNVGFEYVFALLMVALYLAINGAGRLSIDMFIREKRRWDLWKTTFLNRLRTA